MGDRGCLKAICDSDAYIASVTYVCSRATVEVHDTAGNLVFDAVCKNAAVPIGIGWFSDDSKLLCVFKDGKILEYCKLRRTCSISHQVKSRLTSCSILQTGIVASTDDSWVLFIKLDGTKPSGWMLDLNECRHPNRVTQLIGPTKSSWYYVFSSQNIYGFSVVQPDQRSIYNVVDFIFADISPSGRYVSVLTRQGLSVFASNLRETIFSGNLDKANNWKIHWHTDSFLILVNAGARDMLLLSLGEPKLKLINVVPDLYNVIENILESRMGAFLLKEQVLHGENSFYRFHKVHTLELLHDCVGLKSRSRKLLRGLSTDVAFTSAASGIWSNTGSLHEFDASMSSSRSYSMKRRNKLSYFLLLSHKPYSAFKICPDPLKRRFISSCLSRLLRSKSLLKSAQIPFSWVNEAPVMLAHTWHAVSELSNSIIVDIVKHSVANARCKVQSFMRFDRYESALSLLAGLHDYDEVYKAIRAYTPCARYDTGGMMTLSDYYGRYILGASGSVEVDLSDIRHILTCSLDFSITPGDGKKYETKGRFEFVSTRLNILDSYHISRVKRCSPVYDILSLNSSGKLSKEELSTLLSSFGINEHAVTCAHFEKLANSQVSSGSDAQFFFKSSRDPTLILSELTDAYAMK